MKLPAFLFLFLSSVTISSAYAVTEAPGDRSTFTSPSSENLIDLQSDQSTDVYGGQPVRIVVPDVGVFPGWLHGDILQSTFTGAAGKGPSGLAPEPDYLQLVN